jgi:hypothetical protein
VATEPQLTRSVRSRGDRRAWPQRAGGRPAGVAIRRGRGRGRLRTMSAVFKIEDRRSGRPRDLATARPPSRGRHCLLPCRPCIRPTRGALACAALPPRTSPPGATPCRCPPFQGQRAGPRRRAGTAGRPPASTPVDVRRFKVNELVRGGGREPRAGAGSDSLDVRRFKVSGLVGGGGAGTARRPPASTLSMSAISSRRPPARAPRPPALPPRGRRSGAPRQGAARIRCRWSRRVSTAAATPQARNRGHPLPGGLPSPALRFARALLWRQALNRPRDLEMANIVPGARRGARGRGDGRAGGGARGDGRDRRWTRDRWWRRAAAAAGAAVAGARGRGYGRAGRGCRWRPRPRLRAGRPRQQALPAVRRAAAAVGAAGAGANGRAFRCGSSGRSPRRGWRPRRR